MSFYSQAYLDRLSAGERAQLLMTHTTLGYDPESHDEMMVPDIDLTAGMHIIGKQGYGKSGFLENLIDQAATKGHAIVVIDPHGDLVDHVLAQIPSTRVPSTYVFDLEDEAYPFGLNVFAEAGDFRTEAERTQAVERILHIFEILWPEVPKQQYLPMLLRYAIVTFLDNPGTTLVDMIQFFRDDAFRARLLSKVKDHTIREYFDYEYNRHKEEERQRRVSALMNRLQSLFVGRSLVRNILGQQKSTINWRKAIENHEIVLIKLPTTTMKQDAYLIGMVIMSGLSTAIFSFKDTPQDRRPGVSIFVDEFQNFATHDFSKLFTEGRKYGSRLTVAHQYRDQLPDYLQKSTLTARTTVCFRTTPEDAKAMAYLFQGQETSVRPENIEKHPVEALLTDGADDGYVTEFIEGYLRPLKRRWGTTRMVEIADTGFSLGGWGMEMVNLFTTPKGSYVSSRETPPKIDNPTLDMDALLRDVMRTGSGNLPIPFKAAEGYSNCGHSFFQAVNKHRHLLNGSIEWPTQLVVHARGEMHWIKRPDTGLEQFYHFLFHLRATMHYLAEQPMGSVTTTSVAEVAQILMQLPKRAMCVRSGDDTGTVFTHQTPLMAAGQSLATRQQRVRQQTRDKYCHPRYEIERMSGDDEDGAAGATAPRPSLGSPPEGEIKIRRHPGANYTSPGPKRWEDV